MRETGATLSRRLRWDGNGHDQPASGDLRTMARAFVYLFATSGVLVLATLLLPHAEDRFAPGVALPGLAALLTAALVLWRFDRIPPSVFLALPPLGSLLVTVTVFSGGGAAVAVYAMLYFLMVLAAFSLQSRTAGVLNLLLVAGAYGAGLLVVEGTSEIGMRWLIAIGTLTVAGLLIAALRGRMERRVAELRRRGEQQDVIAEIGRKALSGADTDQLSAWAARSVAHNLGVEHAAVFRLVADEGNLVLSSGVGWNPEVERTTTLAVDEDPLLARALESGEPELAPADPWNESEDRRNFDPHRHGAPATGCRRLPPSGTGATGMAIAIHGHSEPVGVLAAYSCSGHPFGAAEAAFIESLANVLADAIRRREAEEQSRRQALIDPLTGRPNRTLFLDRLNEALLRSRQSGSELAVLEVDIDDFQLINDASGHETGDAILQAFAPRLRSSLVMTDTVARIGGDEFAILCEDVGSKPEAVRIAESVQEALNEPFEVGPELFRISGSIGIALADGSGAGADALLARAGAAARRAKASGSGRWELFDESSQRLLRSRRELSQTLRGAAERGEFSLAVQPVRYLGGKPIRCSEVLLRWNHPVLGAVSPAEFIPVAEERGMIDQIGEWVLDQTCRLAAAWRADDHARNFLPLNINISPQQLARPGFVAAIARVLGDAGASPRDLGLEITEHALFHDYDSSSMALEALREMGVLILLDDFGTGYSSLSHVKRLPIDAVKIDRSFVAGLAGEQRDAAIITAISAIASAFVVEVIAEGVETVDQVEALRGLGCLLGQGYYFDEPAPPEVLAPAASTAFDASSRLE